MKKVGRPKKKQEPKDAFHNKTTGEIKAGRFFKMWHQRKKPKTGQTGNIPTLEDFLDTAKRGGRAGAGKSKKKTSQFPQLPNMTDTDILNQVIGYMGYLQDWQKSNITGAEYKGFKKCKDKIKQFIYTRRNAQKQETEQEGEWQI